MTRIIVTRRSADYHACIEEQRDKWREEFADGIEIVPDYVPTALRVTTEAAS